MGVAYKMFFIYKITKISTKESYVGRKTCSYKKIATYWGTSSHQNFYSQRNKRQSRQAESISIEDNITDYYKEILFQCKSDLRREVSCGIEQVFIERDRENNPMNCNLNCNGKFNMAGAVPWNKGKKGVQVAWNKGKSGLLSGNKHPMYGKHHSDETRLKISNSKKGTQAGDKNSFYGKSHSDETRAKISEALIGVHAGDKHPMYGKTHSDEAKVKMSIRHTGRIPWNKGIKGAQVPWNKGKKGVQPCGAETRAKMSASQMARYSFVCPNCNLTGCGVKMKRQHFDACKVVVGEE